MVADRTELLSLCFQDPAFFFFFTVILFVFVYFVFKQKYWSDYKHMAEEPDRFISIVY